MSKRLIIVAGPNGAGAEFQVVAVGEIADYEVTNEKGFSVFLEDVG